MFIESPVQYMKIPRSEHVVYTKCFLFLFWHNMFWAWNFDVLKWWFNEQPLVILRVSWGMEVFIETSMVEVRINASEKDLPVQLIRETIWWIPYRSRRLSIADTSASNLLRPPNTSRGRRFSDSMNFDADVPWVKLQKPVPRKGGFTLTWTINNIST